MSHLFSSLAIGPLQLPNRIVIAPMCQYSARDGLATDWHLMHLGQMAFSGAGLLIIEATAVTPQGRISPADLGLWSDQTATALGRVLASVRPYSQMPIAIQIAHAGRKAGTQVPWLGSGQVPVDEGGWTPVAPSALPFDPADRPPQALSVTQLQEVREAFVSAAIRAHHIGIDAIEVHAAHGYLLHQFLSPLSNKRTDRYGGSLENRMRFPLEVFQAMRAAVPGRLPIGIRISGTDWVEGGWDISQSIAFSHEIQTLGGAFIHVSSGGLSLQQQIPVGPDFQVPLAEAVRREVQIPVIAVGLITEPAQAEAIVAQGRADAVGLARGMLYDPRWPWHAAAVLGGQVQAPPQYWRSMPRGVHGLFAPLGR